MLAVLAFAALVPLFCAFGARAARACGLELEGFAERFGMAMALSLGACTLLVFLLAALQILSVATLLAVVGLMAVAAGRDLGGTIGALVRGLGGLRLRKAWRPRASLEWWAGAVTALFLTLSFVFALAPPTGMDAGVYHFTIPKVILQAGGLESRDDIFIHKSGGFYMVYVLGMGLGGDILAKLMGFAAAAAGTFLVGAVSHRLCAGSMPVSILVATASPISAGFMGTEYLELPILMYLAAATLALLRHIDGGPAWGAVAASLLAGWALSAKPSAFPSILVMMVAWARLLPRGDRGSWATLLVGMGGGLLTGGFWSLWNLASIGHLFHRYPGSAFDAAPMAAGGALPLLSGVLKTLASLATSGAYWTESAGPFIIASVAGFAAFLWASARKPAFLLLLGSVAFYIGALAALAPAYLWTDNHGRYLAPSLICFGAPVAAQFVSWARARERFFRTAVVGALFLPALPLLALKAGKAFVAAPAALGFESRSSYLSKKIETYPACEFLNRAPAGPKTKVLFVGLRPYYLDVPFVHAGGGMESFWTGLSGREELVRRVRDLGITHVLEERTRWAGESRFNGAPFREVGRWDRGHGVFVYELAEN